MSACIGCGGTIEDGYCTVCGLAAAPAPVPALAAATASASAVSGSAVSLATGGSGSRRTAGRSARGRLGAGLVEIPPVPYHDPASAVLADPQVPERRASAPAATSPSGAAGMAGRA